MSVAIIEDENLETVWDWLHIEDKLVLSDIIIGIGSYDDRVAERCAELYSKKLADQILFTGKYGSNSAYRIESEAHDYLTIAVAAGVPINSILLEENATNTGENVRFSKSLLEASGRHYRSAIVVSKPYMTRRTKATFEKQWPELQTWHTAWSESLSQHLQRFEGKIAADVIISTILGDMQRMIDYPAKGYQVRVEIPAEVMVAYQGARAHYTPKPIT